MKKILSLLSTLLLITISSTAFAAQTAPQLKIKGSYTLQPGDSIEVQYRVTPEYNQTVTVQPDGFVSLTLLGNLRVGGSTLVEAHDIILKEADKRLKDPEVSIAVKDFEKSHFTVMGEVANPGRFELRGPVTAVDAVAMAGGFKTSARHTKIIVIHRINSTMGEAHLLDFKALEKNHIKEDFPPLLSGDLIIVPQNKMSKVERYVRLANVGAYYPIF